MANQSTSMNFIQPQAGQKRPLNDCQEVETQDGFPYIVFDTETTGLSLKKDRIVQLSMIKVLSKTHHETFDEYINPELPRSFQLQSKAYKIHNLHPDFLNQQSPFQKTHAEDILKFLDDIKYVFGHNVLFDWGFLVTAFTNLGVNEETGKPWVKMLKQLDFKLVDTMKMSVVAYPELQWYRLSDLVKHLDIDKVKVSASAPKKMKAGGPTRKGELHDALVDVLVTNQVIFNLMDTLHLTLDDISEDSKFSYRISDLDLINKAINSPSSVTEGERKLLTEIAEKTMSRERFSKGRFLKDSDTGLLEKEVDYIIKKRNGIADQIEIKLRRILIQHRTQR
ncbi:DNA polymerase III PolC-type-like [Clytia hemisphaerica]|uniref:DNA polymerase III PolC-type-like n=1 Tax=Clytia hemisphaerica TaxID=252671 RepID=UPI0034D5618C